MIKPGWRELQPDEVIRAKDLCSYTMYVKNTHTDWYVCGSLIGKAVCDRPEVTFIREESAVVPSIDKIWVNPWD